MSSPQVGEPPTKGKVVMKTTLGDLELEFWPKEAPKAVRNFVQLCMEGYYDGTIFHRVVKNVLVQSGDPTGTGTGGESIYGDPFIDEFHSRLRFSHRGLLAMANTGRNANTSQFFFTLDKNEDFNRKYTIFGKVVGDTIYNLLEIGEVEADEQERPRFPPKIVSVDILVDPFDEITRPDHYQQSSGRSSGRYDERPLSPRSHPYDRPPSDRFSSRDADRRPSDRFSSRDGSSSRGRYPPEKRGYTPYNSRGGHYGGGGRGGGQTPSSFEKPYYGGSTSNNVSGHSNPAVNGPSSSNRRSGGASPIHSANDDYYGSTGAVESRDRDRQWNRDRDRDLEREPLERARPHSTNGDWEADRPLKSRDNGVSASSGNGGTTSGCSLSHTLRPDFKRKRQPIYTSSGASRDAPPDEYASSPSFRPEYDDRPERGYDDRYYGEGKWDHDSSRKSYGTSGSRGGRGNGYGRGQPIPSPRDPHRDRYRESSSTRFGSGMPSSERHQLQPLDDRDGNANARNDPYPSHRDSSYRERPPNSSGDAEGETNGRHGTPYASHRGDDRYPPSDYDLKGRPSSRQANYDDAPEFHPPSSRNRSPVSDWRNHPKSSPYPPSSSSLHDSGPPPPQQHGSYSPRGPDRSGPSGSSSYHRRDYPRSRGNTPPRYHYADSHGDRSSGGGSGNGHLHRNDRSSPHQERYDRDPYPPASSASLHAPSARGSATLPPPSSQLPSLVVESPLSGTSHLRPNSFSGPSSHLQHQYNHHGSPPSQNHPPYNRSDSPNGPYRDSFQPPPNHQSHTSSHQHQHYRGGSGVTPPAGHHSSNSGAYGPPGKPEWRTPGNYSPQSSGGVSISQIGLGSVPGAPPPRRHAFDYSRLPETLKFSWNEKEEREFERLHNERRRIALDDERHLADLRRLKFENTLADLEVEKWERQLDSISRLIEEHDAEMMMLRGTALTH